MKKTGAFFKKHKKIFIAGISVLIIAGITGVSLDLKEKHKWKKHPVAPYSYDFENNSDMNTIKNRILDMKTDADLDVSEILTKINKDGTFKGIDYEGTDKSYWQPMDHLKHTLALQIAYYSKGNTHYNDPDVKAAVTAAMNNWIENNYKCTWNWWPNDIGAGQYIPDILLFGVDGLKEESVDRLLSNIKLIQLQNEEVFNGCVSREVGSSGGNLTDKAISTLKVAVLQNDGSTLMWVKHLLETELHPFPSYKPGMFRDDCEGIKEDGSFQQHYQLIYFGGYGEVFAQGLNTYIELTTGTQYALNDEALNLYADFLLDGMQYVTRNGYRDINASGRGAVRVDGLKGIFPDVENGLKLLLKEKNIRRGDEIKQVLEKRFFSERDMGAGGHRYYYESDFQVINNKNYMATVRTTSDRTRIYEYLNGENPLAYYTGLGGNFLYVNGDEYYNILPLYDWTKIPGTTVRQGYLPKYDENYSYGTYGKKNTTGGISNGSIGADFIKLNDNGVRGNKAYFMFENAVVCLGSNISSKESENLATTVNQAAFRGNIALPGGKKLKTGSSETGKFSYIYHNGIGYFTDEEITVSAEHVKGDWKTVNERMASAPVEGDRFTIFIPHKEKKNVSYAYTVLLNTTEKASEEYTHNPRYEVIENTDEIQAVLDKETGTLQAVFHKGGELGLGDGNFIRVNKACLVIAENINGKKAITLSSYDGKERKIKLETNDSSRTVTAAGKSVSVTG